MKKNKEQNKQKKTNKKKQKNHRNKQETVQHDTERRSCKCFVYVGVISMTSDVQPFYV